LIAGCRNYATGRPVTSRQGLVVLPAAVVSVILGSLFKTFNSFFIPHAAIMATLFAIAYHSLKKRLPRERPSPGQRVMLLGLFLLSLDFAHYVILFTFAKVSGEGLPVRYLQFTSLSDLIFEMLLGFGTVMLVMDDALREVESANRELIRARDRLEVLARIDPLTEALNRHAFYSFLEKRQYAGPDQAPGCAVVLDIDNLKLINDSLGHAAGDEAIRRVAASIRQVIRADDLLFRWGGDEFLILLFNISEQAAHARITEMDASLAETLLPGSNTPVTLIVSYGLAPFNSMMEINSAIERADSAMYARKQARKSQERRAG
jgi:diguanylate cyclase (GGDEF)-like protein